MSDNIFGENIKKLRQAFGETQKQLADAIGVAHNYISMWEKGRREIPSNDIVMAIANHYRITVEELFRPIENDGYTTKNLTMSWDDLWKTVRRTYPIFKTDKALEDELFKSALQRHKKLLLSYKNKQPLDADKLVEIMEQYGESWEKNKTIDSLANIMSILCTLCGSFGTIDMIEVEDHARTYGFLGSKKFNEIFLRKDNGEDPLEKAKKEFANQNEEMIEECLENLKKDSKWADVADYYLCIAYMVGMVDNEYGLDTNYNIGWEMIQRFAIMGNPLAWEYIEHISSFYED